MEKSFAVCYRRVDESVTEEIGECEVSAGRFRMNGSGSSRVSVMLSVKTRTRIGRGSQDICTNDGDRVQTNDKDKRAYVRACDDDRVDRQGE